MGAHNVASNVLKLCCRFFLILSAQWEKQPAMGAGVHLRETSQLAGETIASPGF